MAQILQARLVLVFGFSLTTFLAMEAEILQCLAASLNADPNARMSAELRLNELFAKPGPHRVIVA